ncbi:MAG: hypothetical protein RL172_134 [Bacteroidota bacterium]|jgi:hypothetical protein
MTEQLLQYIWQFQYFNLKQLLTTSGEPLHIINKGTLNPNQGPDFLHASIQIAGTTWAGNIELHVLSSQWLQHGHSSDANYQNIILHVVWQHDKEIALPFAVLELQPLVPALLLQHYQRLQQQAAFIPCEKSIQQVSSLTWLAWKERLMVERLQQKSVQVMQYLQQSNQHWQQVCWWMLARNFGMSVNAAAFEAIARSLPLTIMAKHRHQINQLEALLLGQAGLLKVEGTDDKYLLLLQREYHFLKNKYALSPTHVPVQHLRMRPANFPAVRLAQLAMLLQQSSQLFSKFLEADAVQPLQQMLDVTANDYWHYHYQPGQQAIYRPKKTGRQLIHHIIINTVAPLLFAYSQHTGQQQYKARAIGLLQQLPAEKNNIVAGFTGLQLPVQSAFDSQALLCLKNDYCNQKRCLQCAVGNAILKQEATANTIRENDKGQEG